MAINYDTHWQNNNLFYLLFCAKYDPTFESVMRNASKLLILAADVYGTLKAVSK